MNTRGHFSLFAEIFFCFFLIFAILLTDAADMSTAHAKGDLNCDSVVGLEDVIIALQISSDIFSIQDDQPFCSDDVNEDGKINLTEAVYALRAVIQGNSVNTDALKFVIKNIPWKEEAVSGVYVILHGTDNKSVEHLIVTGNDGIADFGNIGRTRAAVSVAYIHEGNVAGASQEGTTNYIQTFMDIPVGDIVFYTDNFYTGNYQKSYCLSPQATINITAGEMPAGSSVDIKPISVVAQASDGIVREAQVCLNHVQNDGTLCLLAEAGSYGQNGMTYLKYGFFLDQAITDKADYAIDLDKTYTDVIWKNESSAALQEIIFQGHRKGIDYSWSQWLLVQDAAQNATSGTFAFPSAFEMDYYRVSVKAGNSYDEAGLTSGKKYDEMPQNLTLSPLPDVSLDDMSYNEETRIYSWSFSGTMESDTMSLFIQGDHESQSEIYWNVLMNGTADHWAVIDLPDEIEENFQMSQSVRNIEISDLDAFNGFDEIWDACMKGNDPFMTADHIHTASRYFPQPEISLPQSEISLPEEVPILKRTDNRKQQNSAAYDPLKGFRGLLRH